MPAPRGGRLEDSRSDEKRSKACSVSLPGFALSIETSQTVHDPYAELDPFIQHLNDYILAHGSRHPDLRVWTWQKGAGQSPSRSLGPLTPEECVIGSFLFIGKTGSEHLSSADLDGILDDLDTLLPVYEWVLRRVMEDRTEGAALAPLSGQNTPFGVGKKKTSFEQKARLIEVDLRHRKIQERLVEALEAIHPKARIEPEARAASGGAMDVRMTTKDGKVVVYELKTGSTARHCIREAMGQLLEYSMWPGSGSVDELVVVSDRPLTEGASQWLNAIRERFHMPIRYRQVVL